MDYLQFAIKEDTRKCVHISQLSEATERGLSCNCVCITCGAAMLSKMGTKRRHHFAHRSNYDKNKCNTFSNTESAIHLMAKDILSEERHIRLPKYYLPVDANRNPIDPNQNEPFLCSNEEDWEYDNVDIEKTIGTIRPDALLYGAKNLIVEIEVTHRTNSNKIKTIGEQDIAAIEIKIDFTEFQHFDKDHISIKEALRYLIIEETKNKIWLNIRRDDLQRYKDLQKQQNEKLEKEWRALHRPTQSSSGKTTEKNKPCPSVNNTYSSSQTCYRKTEIQQQTSYLSSVTYDQAEPPYFCNIPIVRESCFTVERSVWQKYIFINNILKGTTDLNWKKVYDQIVSKKWIKEETHLCPRYWREPDDDVSFCVREYLLYLAYLGFIRMDVSKRFANFWGNPDFPIVTRTNTPPNKTNSELLQKRLKEEKEKEVHYKSPGNEVDGRLK